MGDLTSFRFSYVGNINLCLVLMARYAQNACVLECWLASKAVRIDVIALVRAWFQHDAAILAFTAAMFEASDNDGFGEILAGQATCSNSYSAGTTLTSIPRQLHFATPRKCCRTSLAALAVDILRQCFRTQCNNARRRVSSSPFSLSLIISRMPCAEQPKRSWKPFGKENNALHSYLWRNATPIATAGASETICDIPPDAYVPPPTRQLHCLLNRPKYMPP